MVTINVSGLCVGTPRPADEDRYIEQARALAGEGQDVTLTGLAPVWFYLMVAHALEGRVQTLWYGDEAAATAVLIWGNIREEG